MARLTIEASVRAWQPILIAIITMNVESAEPIHTLELTEAVERYLTGTCDELQKLSSLFFIERTDCTPEPLDLR